VNSSQHTCFDSVSSLCVKRHPHQLSMNEVLKIKKMLNDRNMIIWPIASIASFGLRNRMLLRVCFHGIELQDGWSY